MKNKDNPFYDNHIFSRQDLNRAMFSRWNWMWLWIFPTFVQISDEGFVFFYKVINGAYWVTKVESLPPPSREGEKG